MTVTEKKKMCWSCEGNVPFSAETCPFCGVSLEHITPQKDYKSPYRLAKPEETEAIPVAPIAKSDDTAEMEEDPLASQTKKVMITLACLSIGVMFLIFGTVLFLFSGSDGMLVLKWDGHYWYVYLVIGLPLLIVGWRTLGHIVEQEE